MQIGMNLLLWTTHVTADHYSLLGKLKATGFDGVEVPLFEGEEKHFTNLGGELKKQGLAATAVTCLAAEANPASSDARVRAAALDRLKWAITNTKALGGSLLCGPYHSALGHFSGAAPTAAELAWSADIVRQAAEFAHGAGVTLALEYLNRFECYLLTTAAQGKDYLKQVNHPACKIMYDTFHANIEEKDLAAAMRSLGSDMVHVHISENDRGTPGTGHVDWTTTFKTLKAMKYDRWLTIEAFGRALPDLTAATRVWRDFFPSPDEVYQKGFPFIKDSWAKA